MKTHQTCDEDHKLPLMVASLCLWHLPRQRRHLIQLMVDSPATAPFDSTHGSLALKAYQKNLYLEYYY